MHDGFASAEGYKLASSWKPPVSVRSFMATTVKEATANDQGLLNSIDACLLGTVDSCKELFNILRWCLLGAASLKDIAN